MPGSGVESPANRGRTGVASMMKEMAGAAQVEIGVVKEISFVIKVVVIEGRWIHVYCRWAEV